MVYTEWVGDSERFAICRRSAHPQGMSGGKPLARIARKTIWVGRFDCTREAAHAAGFGTEEHAEAGQATFVVA